MFRYRKEIRALEKWDKGPSSWPVLAKNVDYRDMEEIKKSVDNLVESSDRLLWMHIKEFLQAEVLSFLDFTDVQVTPSNASFGRNVL